LESFLNSDKNKLMLLLDLRKAKKLDPWEIDISEALREALESLNKLEKTNFALLGLLIFNSSVIYELKAESLILVDVEEENGHELEPSAGGGPFFIPGHIRPKVDFLASVISALLSSIGLKRPSKKGLKQAIPKDFRPPPPPEPDFDMAEWREHVLAILRTRGPIVLLRDVLAVFRGSDVIKAFLTLLHMAQEGLVRFSRPEDGSSSIMVVLTGDG